MAEPSSNPDAAFLIYRDGAASALHLRCCDIHLQLDPNDHAVEEAIARHLSRVHGYIGSIDEEISLEALAAEATEQARVEVGATTAKWPPFWIWRRGRGCAPEYTREPSRAYEDDRPPSLLRSGAARFSESPP